MTATDKHSKTQRFMLLVYENFDGETNALIDGWFILKDWGWLYLG
jgi:hypothetical protein